MTLHRNLTSEACSAKLNKEKNIKDHLENTLPESQKIVTAFAQPAINKCLRKRKKKNHAIFKSVSA
jgi:hypothetical protein